MLRLQNNKKVTFIDQSTIEKGTSSEELIDRASQAFVAWLTPQVQLSDNVHIICGPGNNGLDGCRIAQILDYRGYSVYLFSIGFLTFRGAVAQAQHTSYKNQLGSQSYILKDETDFQTLDGNGVLIDAIFGNGLNRKVTDKCAKLVTRINEYYTQIYAVDSPSGLLPHDQVTEHAVQATATFAFQFPKLSFFAAEYYKFIGDWDFESIGLDENTILNTPTHDFLIEQNDVVERLKPRFAFDHKGLMGKSLQIITNPNMMGAGILASRASVMMGAGLVTSLVDPTVVVKAQLEYPAIIFKEWSEDMDLAPYNCICIGPGLGQNLQAKNIVEHMLSLSSTTLVLDADALNLISIHNLSQLIRPGTVLTPHIKEFKRLFGSSSSHYDRVELQRAKAIELGVYILLKGRYTSIATPDGDIYYNQTGNAALARGGSGDILAGMITSLISQGYPTLDAIVIAVFIHGHAADLYVSTNHELSMTPQSLLDYLSIALADISY